MEQDKWLSVKEHLLPLETDILLKHQFGVEAIHFFQAYWRYWYTGKIVDGVILSTATHFMVPSSPVNQQP